MKIADLANLVTVRNHLLTVIADTSITPKTDVKALNDLRRNLDKKFVETIKQLDVEALFAEEDFEKAYFQSKEKITAALEQAREYINKNNGPQENQKEGITLDKVYNPAWLKVDKVLSADFDIWKKYFLQSTEKEGQTFKVEQSLNIDQPINEEEAAKWKAAFEAAGPKLAVAPKQLSLPFDNTPEPTKPKKTRKKPSNDKG